MTVTRLKVVALAEGQGMDKELRVEVGLFDLVFGCFR